MYKICTYQINTLRSKAQAIKKWCTIKGYQQICFSNHSFFLKFVCYCTSCIYSEENSNYVKAWALIYPLHKVTYFLVCNYL